MTSPGEPWRERAAHWSLLLVAVASAIALAWRGLGHRREHHVGVDPLRAVPAGPGLLVTADVERLVLVARSELLRAGGEKLLGLRETCGFEPLLALKRVAFAIPYEAEPSREAQDFAFIAETDLEQGAIVRCAEAVIRKRGGEPMLAQVGQFASVRDRARPLGELGARADGLMVFSGGQYFRDVVDAASGAANVDPSARLRDEVHAELRRQLAPGQLFVSLIPGAVAPFGGLRTAGASVFVDRDVLLRGIVGCQTQAACGELRSFLEQLLRQAATDPELPTFKHPTLRDRGKGLDLSARLPRVQLERLLRLALPAP